VKKEAAAYRYTDEKVIVLVPPYAEARPRKGLAAAAPWQLAAKRAIDVASALFVLLFGLPFYLLIAALIKLTSQGPVLFVQTRLGENGKPFRFYKFRTMFNNCDDSIHRSFTESFIKGKVDSNGGNGGVYKLKDDPRVTPIGRFLRRTSLDELPQFINVLKGEMSLVGPRPPLEYELAHYEEWHKRRLEAKPGLTGLWQVSGRSSVPFDEMVKLDIWYIDNWSLLLDLKIILRTIPVMLFGYGGY
jgi:exopolysaccharide biosynthesis polyprenyl glycosylphosphotransferase